MEHFPEEAGPPYQAHTKKYKKPKKLNVNNLADLYAVIELKSVKNWTIPIYKENGCLNRKKKIWVNFWWERGLLYTKYQKKKF